MILLQEDPGDSASNADFEKWLKARLVNQQAWKNLAFTTDTLRSSSSQQRPAINRQIKAPVSVSYNSNFATQLSKIAALVIFTMFLSLALSYLPQAYVFARADMTTSIGEMKKYTLPDGSLVFLGAKSAMNINYDVGFRRVELLAGQAFFEVKKNQNRPFVVRSKNTITKVTGTRFEVNASSSTTAVSVQHGSVIVSQQTNKAIKNNNIRPLQIGESLAVDEDGRTVNYQIDPQDVAAWRKGKLVVFDKKVKDVIAELKHHYQGLIITGLGSIANKRITGVYDLSNPVEALQVIVETHGARARQITKWLIVISPI